MKKTFFGIIFWISVIWLIWLAFGGHTIMISQVVFQLALALVTLCASATLWLKQPAARKNLRYSVGTDRIRRLL
ncbi:MAG: hypothetical protein UW68_C0006G0010 [Candidatus Collierbacteria bacterium GW2011_GWB1_44_6]|uniref:Uncharacterized protein n=2 Tax=Candidatus Collieribacteriota TaxID=1752725 RepID=A0A0G1JQB1_9BACT|nr:MAG: hypothetical protein UV68_C0020G0010 [Candidatus Collierbacteria bacterium GW2011_GWC2_43_12]KKT73568.1 MAG: hypothetical protein UW68_C0006G0010 [Candidatus Collierbacteria bacterium GW2011_GWB1_44_6]KKT83023.1 MAG: hypothetical protein UW80_C0024G0014 [Microgenomates group bacterium GW2011_GWC1_44_9]